MTRFFASFSFAFAFACAFALLFACTTSEPTQSSLVAEGEGESELNNNANNNGDDDDDDDGGGDDDDGGGEGEGEGEQRECESEVISAPAGGACDAATKTCLDACGEEDEACFENCLNADSGGENCLECVEESFLACVNDGGCQAAFDAIVCCSDTCPDPDADECYTNTCATESNAYDECIDGVAACDEADAICFAQ